MIRRALGLDPQSLTYDSVCGALCLGTPDALEESEYLDFKKAVSTERPELARDVCSFANRGGGVLLFGVDETGGRAVAVTPLALEQRDSLQQSLNTLVQPAVPGLRWHTLADSPNGTTGLILLEIPPSPLRPHAVVHKRQPIEYWLRLGDRKERMGEAEVERAYRERVSSLLATEEALGRAAEKATVAHELGCLWLAATPLHWPRRIWAKPRDGLNRMDDLLRNPALKMDWMQMQRSVVGDHHECRFRRVVAMGARRWGDSPSTETFLLTDHGLLLLTEPLAAIPDEVSAQLGSSPKTPLPRLDHFALASFSALFLVAVREVYAAFDIWGEVALRFGLSFAGNVVWMSWRPTEVHGTLEEPLQYDLTASTEELEDPSFLGRRVGEIYEQTIAAFGERLAIHDGPADKDGRIKLTFLYGSSSPDQRRKTWEPTRLAFD